MLYEPVDMRTFEKGDLVFALGDDYSESTRDNAVVALLETFRESPIGDTLKQGISITSGGVKKYKRHAWEHPDSVAILYALYRYAEETGRYAFSLSQLNEARKSGEAKGVDPVTIFGLSPDGFQDILKELAIHFENHIKVSFMAGLDSVRLMENISSVDVLDLAKQ
jgi:phosphoadenosine phosphosulfate reductase